ncbi:FecR family protein [Flavobacteriaceae bacterium GF1]
MEDNPKYDWSNERKTNLRNRILTSARREKEVSKSRKRHWYYVAAASVIPLVLALGYYFGQPTEPSLEEFVKTSSKTTLFDASKVTVVLGEGEQIAMDEDEGHVEYSETGSSVTFGQHKKTKQQTVNDDTPIFNTIMVPYGKRSFIKLSDNTKVWINSGSKLIFPAIFTSGIREVYLEGEAIFEVAHNEEKPFQVRSSTQTIEVLGTIFNVSHYSEDDLMKTVLKSGSIRMTYRDDKKNSFLMKPGTLSSFDKNSNEVSTKIVNPDHYFSWREGYLTLHSNRLDDITARLSRYYNRTIEIENEELASLTFSGRLDLSEDLGEVLETIKQTKDFQIIANNGTVLLKP